MPHGYEEDPPQTENESWEVSPRLERSLATYAGLEPPTGVSLR
jgi:hypothetical protein